MNDDVPVDIPAWLWTIIGVAAGLVVVWIALVAAIWIQQRRLGTSLDWREILRLVPDVVRLLRRLAADPDVPRGVRWTLGILLGYLLLPIDLVPDFLPVIGFADDAVVVVFALRLAVNRAGRASVEKHWPGSENGLRALLSLAGL